MLEWDWETALVEYDRAVAAAPHYVWGIETSGQVLVAFGRIHDARALLERARKLDPLSISATPVDLGSILELMGETAGAEDAWRSMLELFPAHFHSLNNLGAHLCVTGRPEEGLVLLQRSRELYPGTPLVQAELAACLVDAGQTDRARELLMEIEAQSAREYVDPVNMAVVHMALGDQDAAFAWLERGYELRSTLMVNVPIHRRLQGLRDDPRFSDLLRRMNYPGVS
jgi:Flp pilus assembly protein TadD